MSLLSCPCSLQLSQNVPAYAGFLCDKATVFMDTIKVTPLYTVSVVPGRNVGEVGIRDDTLKHGTYRLQNSRGIHSW